MVLLAQLVVAEDCGSSGPGFKPLIAPLLLVQVSTETFNGCTEYKLLVANFEWGLLQLVEERTENP